MSETASPGPSRNKRVVKAPYGKGACNPCRKAKARCEGKPECNRCIRLNHACIRGEDNRKAFTRLLEQALRHKIIVLESKVDALNSELSAARISNPSGAGPSSSGVSSGTGTGNANGNCVEGRDPREERLHRILGSLRVDDDPQSELDTDYPNEPNVESDMDDTDSESSDSGDEDGVRRLTARRRTLFVEYDELHEYGLTAVFRLPSKRSASQRRAIRLRRRREESPHGGARYNLQIPGLSEQPSCACDPPCWNRHLPKDVPLTKAEHDLLLDRTFLFFSSWCMRVIPELFLRDMHRALHAPPDRPPPKTAHYSALLHLCVMAVATAFSDDPAISDLKARARLAEEAKKHIEDECRLPSISGVQALGLLGSYYSGLGEQTLGFVYFGMSARISQALGLGTDCTQWVQTGHIKTRDLFDRFWCFHMVCAQDACWSLYVGREFGVPMGQSDPHAMADMAYPSVDTMAWRHYGDDTAPQQCYSFQAFLWTCQLMKKSRQIMTLMNALSSSESGIEIKRFVADIDIQLISWYEDLPHELKVNLKQQKDVATLPHLLMMHLSFRWLLILLHRPFYRRQRGVEADLSYKRCNVAAREILTILRIWRKLYGSLRFAPITIVQTIFAAGTVALLSAQQAATGRRPAPEMHAAAIADVQEVIDVLRETGQSWHAARKIADIFEKILEGQKRLMENGGAMKRGRAKKRGRGRESAAAGKSTQQQDSSVEAIPKPEQTDLSPVPGLHDGYQNSFHHGHDHSHSPGVFPPHQSPTELSGVNGTFDQGLQSDTDQQGVLSDGTVGEDYPMADYDIWTIFSSQLNAGAPGAFDWRVGTGLTMDDGSAFADQPFMAFGPPQYVQPVQESEAEQLSDIDVDDQALHDLIASMKYDGYSGTY